MKISVIGLGRVGLSEVVYLSSMKHEITAYDVDKKVINLLENGYELFSEPSLKQELENNYDNITYTNNSKDAYTNKDVIVLAVGTPMKNNGDIELKFIRQAVRRIMWYANKDLVIIIKSTVPVGTNQEISELLKEMRTNIKITVISCPEFLREGHALEDTYNPFRVVVGLNNKSDRSLFEEIYGFYSCPVVFTSPRSAEMAKYASNNFLAMKVSFVNEIANITDKVGADINDVLNIIGLDPRIGDKYLKPGIGYGGPCLEKDAYGLLKIAKKNGYNPKLLKASIEANKRQRILLIERVKRDYKTFKDTKIGILGIAFKNDSDDMRGAPSLDIINYFIKEKAIVSVYDKKALSGCEKIFGQKIKYISNLKDIISDNDMLIQINDIEELNKLKQKPKIYKMFN